MAGVDHRAASWGIARPSVSAWSSAASAGSVWEMKPHVSVCPNTIVTWTPRAASMWRTRSAGTTAPPELTDRRDDRSRRVKSGWSIIATSIVGTPTVKVPW